MGGLVLEQAGDGEALAAAELDRGLRAARGKRRNREALDTDRAGVRKLADLGDDLEADEIALEHGRRKAEAHAELLEFDRDRRRVAAAVGLGHRDRKLAARQEIRALARDRGQVRLGQDRDQTLAGKRVDHRVQIGVALVVLEAEVVDRRIGIAQELVGAAQHGVADAERGHEGADAEGSVPVEPELLQGVAGNLGEAHPQIDLVGAQHPEAVDDLVALADETRRQAARVLGLDRIFDRAGQNQRPVRRAGGDVGIG